jgi:hypothetical protein
MTNYKDVNNSKKQKQCIHDMRDVQRKGEKEEISYVKEHSCEVTSNKRISLQANKIETNKISRRNSKQSLF